MEPLWATVLFAGFVSMDTTAGPQFLFSEPLISCTVAGYLYGDPLTGLMMGVLFQMLWIGYLPLGAVHFTDNNMGALIGTASLLAAKSHYGLTHDTVIAMVIPAVLFGIWMSMIGLHLRNVVRRLNGNRSERLLAALEQGTVPSIAAAHLAGISCSFLKGAAMALPGIMLGMFWCGAVRMLPSAATIGLTSAASVFSGALVATAMLFYWNRNRHQALALGVVAGVLLIVMVLR